MKPQEECIKILNAAKTAGYEQNIPEAPLKALIMNIRNVIDDRALNNWIKALITFGYIERKSPYVYQIKNGNTET